LGAYAFRSFQYYSFFAPAAFLIYALLYDVFRVNAKRYYRKIGNKIKGNKLIAHEIPVSEVKKIIIKRIIEKEV